MRIEALKTYLINVLNELNKEFKILNINFLASDIDNFSIDKIPTKTLVETSITGIVRRREVYNFRSRNNYGSEVASNLSNMGFWERFESKIYSNNEQGILPNGINEIKCLNCGSLQRADTHTCEMSIQIEINYKED